MLFRYLAAALAGGLAIDAVVASAVGVGLKKREVPATHVLHERQMPHWSRTWNKKEKLRADALLPMRIGLKQSNLGAGHDLLMEM